MGVSPTKLKTIQLRREQAKANGVKPHPEDRSDFDNYFIILHEFAHLFILDWTPAKSLAKAALSLSYESIMQLITSSVPIEEAWKGFTVCTDILNETENNIAFVEELIATAYAIRILELEILPGGMWTGFQEELALLIETVLANEEINFPGFRTYYKRIKVLIPLMMRHRHLAANIIPLLQPVRINKNGRLGAYNTRNYIDTVLNIIESPENAEEAYQRLLVLNEKELKGWIAALLLVTKQFMEPFELTKEVWNIFMPDLEYLVFTLTRNGPGADYISLAEHVIEKFLTVTAADGLLPKKYKADYVVLSPVVKRTHNYDKLRMSFHGIDFPPSISLRYRNYTRVLFFEGLRQQILARKGFVCPNQQLPNRDLGCRCEPEVQELLRTLYYLARDGLFGPGEWSLPPCLPLR